ncbi:uncharacterized protein [Cicer arietinum]|nr:uncharacterized protein LOC105852315 isoform X2 [Cicer arietinum]
MLVMKLDATLLTPKPFSFIINSNGNEVSSKTPTKNLPEFLVLPSRISLSTPKNPLTIFATSRLSHLPVSTPPLCDSVFSSRRNSFIVRRCRLFATMFLHLTATPSSIVAAYSYDFQPDYNCFRYPLKAVKVMHLVALRNESSVVRSDAYPNHLISHK